MNNDKKGFTLAELLIVVAIIAVLVAVAVPVFSSQLEKSKEAVDVSNLRAAYTVVRTAELTGEYKNWDQDGKLYYAYYDAATGQVKNSYTGIDPYYRAVARDSSDEIAARYSLPEGVYYGGGPGVNYNKSINAQGMVIRVYTNGNGKVFVAFSADLVFGGARRDEFTAYKKQYG